MIVIHLDSLKGLRKELKRLPVSKVSLRGREGGREGRDGERGGSTREKVL